MIFLLLLSFATLFLFNKNNQLILIELYSGDCGCGYCCCCCYYKLSVLIICYNIFTDMQ